MIFLQLPAALQLFVPVHSGLSNPLVTVAQVPVVHTRQGVVQAELQHRPSLQKPVAHCEPDVQVTPLQSGVHVCATPAMQFSTV